MQQQSIRPRSRTLITLSRAAGLLYAVIILCGVWAEGIARPSLIMPGDHVATMDSIASGLSLFRASMLADLTMALADVALAMVFFSILSRVSHGLALAAMTFRLIQAALIACGLVALAAIPGVATVGAPALVRLLLDLHAIAYDVGLVFFAVNSAIMALLLWWSGGVPKVIAVGIAMSGIVYLTGSLLRLIAPELVPAFSPAYIIPLAAESALCLWLIVRGRI